MTMKIRAVLVDDEPLARVRLASLLTAHPEVEVVGEAGDVEAAAVLCGSLLPDVVFLDIHLPGGSGFELLPRLAGKPAIVFVTAFDRFALRAFAVNALDYLLKPIHPGRLALSLARLASPAPEPTGMLDDEDLVSLRGDRGLSLVPLASITHIISEGNRTKVYQSNSAPALVRRSLTEWERLLPTQTFLRVDRSLIARLTAVKSLVTLTRERGQLVMVGSEEAIPLGRAALLRLRHAGKDSRAG